VVDNLYITDSILCALYMNCLNSFRLIEKNKDKESLISSIIRDMYFSFPIKKGQFLISKAVWQPRETLPYIGQRAICALTTDHRAICKYGKMTFTDSTG